MKAIQTTSVSGFRNNYKDVLNQVSNGPVLLLQNSRLAAVLVSEEEWNAIAGRLKRLKELELLLEAKHINAEMDHDPSRIVPHQELKQKLAEKAHSRDVGT